MLSKIKKILCNLNHVKILAIGFLFFILYVGVAAAPEAIRIELNNIQKAKEDYGFIEIRNSLDKTYKGMLTTKKDQPLLQNKATYINLNGFMAKAMGQKYMNKIIKLNNGNLSPFGEQKLVHLDAEIEQITELYNRQKKKGKYFLFILAPYQISKYNPQTPIGHKEYSNASADVLIKSLKKNKIPVLDLREKMYEQQISHEDAFFKTDHHWKPQTGFWAYTEILNYLEKDDVIPQIDDTYTDVNKYKFQLHKKNWFLGSSGKRTGQYYAGTDDFYLIIPKFKTGISLTIPSAKIKNEGNFEDVAYNRKVLQEKNYFNQDPYSAYGYSNQPIAYWRNQSAPIQKKMLMIGDSFGNVPFSLLSLVFSTCDEMDTRHYKDNFEKYYDEFDPDIMIVMINAQTAKSGIISYDYFK